VPPLREDRVLATDIAKAEELVRAGGFAQIWRAVEPGSAS
jgi:hypothetical protein